MEKYIFKFILGGTMKKNNLIILLFFAFITTNCQFFPSNQRKEKDIPSLLLSLAAVSSSNTDEGREASDSADSDGSGVIGSSNSDGSGASSSSNSDGSGTNPWSQQAYLKAPNAGIDDWFGYSVSISGDTIVVGSYGEDSNQTTITNGATASGDNSASDSGAAYVFVRNGSTWSQQAYLKAPNADANDAFGQSVSLSGDSIVVGASLEDSNQTTITHGAVASSNNVFTNSGATYVFIRSGTNWSQEAYLKAPNAGIDDRFGSSVSISGDTIVVGAHREDGNQTTITNGATASGDNSFGNSGAAYVFFRE